MTYTTTIFRKYLFFTWDELKQLAANRDAWRQRVRAICSHHHDVHVKYNDKVPTGPKCDWERKPTTSQSPTPDVDTDALATARYRKRDAHERFFRPELKQDQCKHMRRAKNKRQSNPPTIASSEHSTRSPKSASYTDSFILQSPPTIHGHHRQQNDDNDSQRLSLSFSSYTEVINS